MTEPSDDAKLRAEIDDLRSKLAIAVMERDAMREHTHVANEAMREQADEIKRLRAALVRNPGRLACRLRLRKVIGT